MKDYTYLCTYSCGHSIAAHAAIPIPAMRRLGQPGVCYECEPRRLDVEIIEWLDTGIVDD